MYFICILGLETRARSSVQDWYRVTSHYELMPMTEPVSSFSGQRWEPEQDLIFSSREGFVWASWPETEVAVRLGRHEVVAEMMRDFLAQDALGKRLTQRGPHA
jgi:hypothetical protein